MKVISTKQAIDMIFKTEGKFFSITFIKKDGSDRYMRARLGVKKDLKGVGMKYKPADYDLINVYDMDKKSYRMINLKSLKSLQINKIIYSIID